jgi:archaellin
MGSLVGTTLTIAILSLSSILIGATVTSVIDSESESITTDYNLEKLASDAMDEISTYLQIRDQKGKYTNINGEQRIDKIAILISPLVSQKIDLSRLTIQLCNDKIVKILRYNGNLELLDSSSLFEHSIWDKLNGNNFGFISINDYDRSLTTSSLLNDFADNVYIVIRLPADMTMKNYDKLIVSLFPATGMTSTLILEASFPIKQVITFE